MMRLRSLAAQGDRVRAGQILERCEQAGTTDPARQRRIERLRKAMETAP